MTRFLLVAIGGALGSMARYGVGLAAGRLFPGAAWPFGTMTVNLLGGLVMGLVIGWIRANGAGYADAPPHESLRLLLAVGVLGGFTTFSAFSLETVVLIERREVGLAAAYVAVSVVCAIAAVFLGLMIARRAFGAAA